MNVIKIAAAALTLAFGATVAMAQAPAPAAPVAPKAPAATTPPPAAPAGTTAAKPKSNLKQAKTPEGAACSAEADAKGLHGKPRKAFRAKCMKEKAPAAAKKS